jgi:hypothetical protein
MEDDELQRLPQRDKITRERKLTAMSEGLKPQKLLSGIVVHVLTWASHNQNKF